ncbi:MAG: S49 family peptidase [Anaerolineaceae bacterium]
MESTEKERSKTAYRWLLWLLIPLAAGILISLLIPRPAVGVIYLDDAIYGYTSRDLTTQIIHAREDPNIKALVFVMNSPGGTVSDTESVYRELMLLRQTKPVVTVIEGMAASGGYYLASGSDYIISKASSEVGNIGVIGYLPDSPIAIEAVYSTGPYKMWGMPRESFVREMEMLKQQFLEVVQQGRGERLQMKEEEILSGKIYVGGDALRLGLIDEFGSVSDGIDKAASLAKISHQITINLNAFINASTPEPFFQGSAESLISSYPNKAGIYFLYVQPAEERLP